MLFCMRVGWTPASKNGLVGRKRDTYLLITPTMLVELTDEETTCSICCSKFSSDIGSTDDEIRKHLPVLSSSKSCDHWCVTHHQIECGHACDIGETH